MTGNIEDVHRLSSIQQGMLFHSVVDPAAGDAPYTSQFVDDLRGPFDPEILTQAWQAVTERHSVLRSCFVWENVDEPVQVVLRRVQTVVSVLDWCDRAATEREGDLARFIAEDRARGFDLDKPPLHRFTLIRFGPQDHVLILTVHHLLVDGWSTAALYSELFEAYGRLLCGEHPESEPAPPYARYIDWLGERDKSEAEQHWRRYLAGHSGMGAGAARHGMSRLPADSGHGREVGQLVVELDAAHTAAAQTFCQARSLTVNSLLQGALALALSGMYGEDDVIFGAVCSNRPSEIDGVERIVGPLINTLPIRVRIDRDATVARWLAALQTDQLVCRRYGYAALTDVQSWSDVPADSSLFDCLYVFQNNTRGGGEARAGLPERRRRQSAGSLAYPLSVLAECDRSLKVVFEYDRIRYSDKDMNAVAGLFSRMITMMTSNERPVTHVGDLGDVLDECEASAPRQRVGQRGQSSKRLVAYIVASDDQSVDSGELTAHLHRLLPEYMVPTDLVTLHELPLTTNGKLDRAALPEPVRTPSLGSAVAPRTRLESTIAGVWCDVLHRDHVGVHDNFFALGGDSIESLRVIGRLKKLDVNLTPRDLMVNETVAKLAAAALAKTPASGPGLVDAEQGAVFGTAPATPIQRWFLEQAQPVPGHYNQAVVLDVGDWAPGSLRSALEAVIAHHDALRTRFPTAPPWTVETLSAQHGSVLTEADLRGLPAGQREERWQELAEQAQGSMDPERGSLVRAVLADLGPDTGRRLLVAIHHMAVDIVSWSILLEDLHTAYEQAAAQEPIQLPPKTSSYQSWARQLARHAAQPESIAASLPLWSEPPSTDGLLRITPGKAGPGATPVIGRRHFALDPETSSRLMSDAPTAIGVGLEDLVLSALATALCAWSGRDRMLVDIESHGREHIFEGLDLTRTVGWFTSIHPIEVTVPSDADPIGTALAIAARRKSIPDRGIAYGILEHLADDSTRQLLRSWPTRQIAFNFHGKETTTPTVGLRQLPDAETGAGSHPANRPQHALSMDASFVDGQFHAQITHSDAIDDAAISEIVDHFRAAFVRLADPNRHAASAQHGDHRGTRPTAPSTPGAGLVELNGSDRDATVFCFPYSGGEVGRYNQLARCLRPIARVYGLQDQAHEIDERGSRFSLADIAASYLEQIRIRQPVGPYVFAGWSFGGVVAQEVARQTILAGSDVRLLCIIDTKLAGPSRRPDALRMLSLIAKARALTSSWTAAGPPTELTQLLPELQVTPDHLELGPDHLHDTLRRCTLELAWLLEHAPSSIGCPTLLVEASASQWGDGYVDAWRSLASPLTHRLVRGDHKAPMTAPGVIEVADLIAEAYRT